MRYTTLTLGLAGAIGLAAPAQAQVVDRVIFLGFLVITNAANCDDIQVGEQWASRYHLGNLGANPNKTAISTFDLRSADSYTKDPGRFTNQFSPVVATGIDNFGETYEARVRLTGSVPPSGQITATTNAVSITGVIESPRDDIGVGGQPCRATFRASYTRRVE